MKKTVILLLLVLFLSGCRDFNNPLDPQIDKYNFKRYSIGDRGPARGYIFHVELTEDFTWKYYEVAPQSWGGADKEYEVAYYQTEHLNAAQNKGVGFGESNTKALNDHIASNSIASKVCADLTYWFHDDWYLPSIDELELIYLNLYENDIDVFERSEVYWSSTLSEISGDAYQLYSRNGSIYSEPFYWEYRIVPVRSFN